MLLPAPVAGYLHRLYKAAERRDPQLLYLFVELTRKCNLTCRHCGSDCTTATQSDELSTGQWMAVLERIAETFSPPPTLVLTGGEPILHPDFAVIVQRITNLGMRWGLVTNGYELTDKVMAVLQDNNCYSITVSVDGLNDAHNWLRGRSDAFERMTGALDRIAASSIPLRDAVTCVNPRNSNELDAIARLLIAHKMPAWRLFRIFPAGRAKDNDRLLLTVDATKKMINWVRENRTKLCSEGVTVQLSCEGWLPFAVDRQVRDQPFFCRAGINIASILSDGTVTGCSNNDQRFYQGSVLEESLSVLWRTKFGAFRDRSWVKETSCGSCSHVKKCEGGSIHLWRGDRDKPDFCYAECF